MEFPRTILCANLRTIGLPRSPQGPPRVPSELLEGPPRVPPRVPPTVCVSAPIYPCVGMSALILPCVGFSTLIWPCGILSCVNLSAPIWLCVDSSAPMSPCVSFSANTYAPSYAHANIQTRCEVLLDRRARSRWHAA